MRGHSLAELGLANVAVVAALAWAQPACAQGQAKGASVMNSAETLTPEEIRERDSRKACKVAICDAFHNRRPDGPDVACRVVKSWRKEQLSKLVEKAKVSWPWGKVSCVVDIRLKRDMLIKAMVEPKYEATLDKHQVNCQVEREKDGNVDIKFDFAPKVRFENGKAVSTTLNWGRIEAPTVVKGAMWTATATDNTFNVLQGTVVEDINDFVDSKCQEVKDEWAKK